MIRDIMDNNQVMQDYTTNTCEKNQLYSSVLGFIINHQILKDIL